ncbi:MAG TPA: biopolymer transporter ExbD [Candidatus Dormibacteraeota bacterium]|nr:biopolymer transporter ExbD [Candidatus Dormibacteraeota bacterium]
MAMQLGSSGVKSDINVTPFVDIVLVLLIIFMVVTPMLSRALDVAVPPKTESNVPPDPTEQLIISVKGPDSPPKVYLNREEISGGLDGVKDRVAELMKGRREKIVFFQADNDLVYQDVVNVMDKIREGGADIGLITDENLDVTQGAQ